ncbi:hypothetical protein LCGC14_0429200 [marine sediment metagenome]|uniref:Uncharacterized protein n=1 Tax=marine sediment metagenome TaxID=412755 RepID=A0A0F9T6S5_9ZZZZ
MPLTEEEEQSLKSGIYNLTNQMESLRRQVEHLGQVINNQAAALYTLKQEIEGAK